MSCFIQGLLDSKHLAFYFPDILVIRYCVCSKSIHLKVTIALHHPKTEAIAVCYASWNACVYRFFKIVNLPSSFFCKNWITKKEKREDV